MSEENKPQLFEDNSRALMLQADAASVARATQEIQAALVIGMNNPRDEVRAESRIMNACKRKSLAEVAEYEYSRGGTKITGPTIDLLRAIANRWGNLLFGWSEVERTNGQSLVRCWAWDTQFNSRAERSFVVRHWRDTAGGGYAITDERDIYELIANMASRRVRACLEEIIDADIVDKAVDQCRRTLKEGERTPLKDRVVAMVNAFEEHGVTPAMIEKRLGNKLDAVSENQLASLRRVFKSIKDGVGRREDFFKPDVAPPEFKPPTNQPTPAAAAAKPAPEPEDDLPMGENSGQPANAVPPPASPEPPAGINYLRALRLLAKADKVKEGDILNFLSQSGATDGSIGSLEELQIGYPNIVKMVVDDWNKVRGQILESK